MKTLFLDNSVLKGLAIGAKVGFVFSATYGIVGFIIIEALGNGTYFFQLSLDVLQSVFTTLTTNSFSWGNIAASFMLIGLVFIGLLMVVFYITILAIVPSTFLGGITGFWLGVFTKTASQRFSKNIFVSLCALSCLCVVLLIHGLFKIPLTFSFQGLSSDEFIGGFTSYPFLIGVPSLIYIFTGGWIGLRLYLQTTVKIDEQN